MRVNRDNLAFLKGTGDNLGLYVDKLNQEIDDPKVDDGGKHKEKMFEKLASFSMGKGSPLQQSYQHAFERWRKTMEERQDCLCFEIINRSRLLLGTGNDSIYEFGVNLNRPWGVPCISGATLKGALSSYLAQHGAADWAKDVDGLKGIRQADIFGGSFLDDEKSFEIAGVVDFFDAWLSPGAGYWFEADITTPHHTSYYRGENLPSGIEAPVPAKLAALAPRQVFFVVMRGERQVLEFLKIKLGLVLDEEGIGGKTAVGYGRFDIVKSREEINKALKAAVHEASSAELLRIEKEQVKKHHFSIIAAELERRPYDKELDQLYLKYSPLITVSPADNKELFLELLKRIKDTVKKLLKNQPAYYMPKTLASSQNVLRQAGDLGLSREEIKNHAVLKNILPTWEELGVTAESFDEQRLDEYLQYTTCSSLLDLKNIVAASKLDEESKEIIYLEMEDAQKY